MKCKACGFNDKEPEDPHDPYEKFGELGEIRDDHGNDHTLYVCPKCWTVRCRKHFLWN